VIYETAVEAATNTDILNGTRLNAIPYNGQLTFEFQCNVNTAAAHFTVTIQEPNGDVPIDAQLVPGTNPALDGVLDDRQLLRMSFRATQGGHFNVSLTETGTALCMWRCVLSP